jgi:hypothetical protein
MFFIAMERKLQSLCKSMRPVAELELNDRKYR